MRAVMPDLTALAKKWHTAKVLTANNPLSHNYMPTYEKLLAGVNVRRVLEIGLGWKGLVHQDQVAGCSLFMWAEAFPDADIYGLDIREDTLVNQGRIHSFLMDQTKPDQVQHTAGAMEKYVGQLDFIVDDACHDPLYQALTAKWFVPLLSKGGVYVIEDVHSPERLISKLPFDCQVFEFNPDLGDDRLVVIRG